MEVSGAANSLKQRRTSSTSTTSTSSSTAAATTAPSSKESKGSRQRNATGDDRRRTASAGEVEDRHNDDDDDDDDDGSDDGSDDEMAAQQLPPRSQSEQSTRPPFPCLIAQRDDAQLAEIVAWRSQRELPEQADLHEHVVLLTNRRGGRCYIVGTAHISQASVDVVEQVLAHIRTYTYAIGAASSSIEMEWRS